MAGGRLTLVNAVLRRIHIYCLLVIQCHKSMIRRLEKLMRAFTRRGKNKENGSNLVNSKLTSLLVYKGGLGMEDLFAKSISLLEVHEGTKLTLQRGNC